MKKTVSPTRVGGLALLFVAALFAGNARLGAVPAAPTMNPAVVLGPNVTLSWAAVPGATSYRLAAGVTPGGVVFTQNVGNITSVGVTAPLGVFHVRVHAVDASGESLPSNEIDVRVTSLVVPPAPPAAPTDLAAYINGTSALITWSPGQGGGAPTGLVLFAGTTPGASDIGTFPVGLGTQLSVPNLGAGNYYLRIAAANAAGLGPASNEVLLSMPVGGGCSAPPARTFTASAFGRYVQFGWQGVPGAAGYRLDFSATPGGPVTASLPFGPNQTGYAVTGAPLGVFYGKLVTAFSCGQQTPGPEVALTIDGAPPPGPRAAEPGGRTAAALPLAGWGRSSRSSPPNARTCSAPRATRAAATTASCSRRFGAFGRVDNRSASTGSAACVGDLSQDIVNYNYRLGVR